MDGSPLRCRFGWEEGSGLWQAMTTTQTNPSSAAKWYPWILVAATILAFANSFGNPFLFDDVTVVTQNPHITNFWPPWAPGHLTTRVVADATFALNYALGGFRTAGYHAVNLLIHLLAGVLLYGVIRRSLRPP